MSQLLELHADPFDRVLTPDESVTQYPVRAIW
jgi:PIN domain nuclease of toxin-antitoxin system